MSDSARVDPAASGASAQPAPAMKNKADSNYLLTARADPNQFKSGSIFALGLGVILLLFPSCVFLLSSLLLSSTAYIIEFFCCLFYFSDILCGFLRASDWQLRNIKVRSFFVFKTLIFENSFIRRLVFLALSQSCSFDSTPHWFLFPISICARCGCRR
jgi:hypothetical protein